MQNRSGVARIGDLIRISPVSPVVSLMEVERTRASIRAGQPDDSLRRLLAHYCLDDVDTRAAFEVILSGLARGGALGDAFHIQGTYGTGKSHLLAAIALLVGHPEASWQIFLEGHPGYAELGARFEKPRFVVAIPLDEYPTRRHTLEYVVLSGIERELRRCGVRAALTEESHLLDLVDRYVLPQDAEGLQRACREAAGESWEALKTKDPERAAEAALTYVESSDFPLDWRRSRSEVWAELSVILARETRHDEANRQSTRAEAGADARSTRAEAGADARSARAEAVTDGVVIVLDELGLWLSSKDRAGLNADASFLQWLAQRTASARAWVVCATQRGLEEVGDIDGRTLRQVRDRFRSSFTLDLAELGWVVRHAVAPRREPAPFARAMEGLAAAYRAATGDELVSARELAASYPINPRCLIALRRAAESHLSRTRSAVKLLSEAAKTRAWESLPADRLITPDVVFDVFRDEMSMSAAGRKQLHVFDVVMANAERIARGRESEIEVVMKTLCLLGLGELRWSERDLRASLVGCSEGQLWQDGERLRGLLRAVHQRGAYVERNRREAAGGDEYYVDVSSDATERMRQRLSELSGALSEGDSRVLAAALASCREGAFPMAVLAETSTFAVNWLNARRLAGSCCRDLRELSAAELGNQAAMLGSPHTRQDAGLFLASPLADVGGQREAWLEATKGVEHRFAVGLMAWLPGGLSPAAREHFVEHAALTLMIGDRTAPRRGGEDYRERLRERWAASEEEVRRALQRAYYEGEIIGAEGEEVIPRERLWGLFGDWEETLREVCAQPFGRLFPRFGEIAPQRLLTGRVQTNQVVDQFLRPGEVTLPPASALEAHLHAYAVPLGLVEGEGRHLRLALKKTELVEAALGEVPARTGEGPVDPEETAAFGEVIGRLAKGEWGLTREQGELLIGALIRTGHLVGLDAFLQPVRLEQVAAPLGDSVPFLMRGRGLGAETARRVRELWEAASGQPIDEWSLPAQERAWGFFVEWARVLKEKGAENAEAITRAALSLGQAPEEWDWAREALGCAEALARSVEASRTSMEGLEVLAGAAERLPGEHQQTRRRVAEWRSCEGLLGGGLAEIARVRDVVMRAQVPSDDGLLARERAGVLQRVGDSRGVAAAPEEVRREGERWLESYRKHYLAWHGQVHGAGRFEGLAGVRRSAGMEVMRRLARSGLCVEEAARVEAEVSAAMGRRCLAGDPLPAGEVVCPICRVGFKEEVALPEAGEVRARVEEVVGRQWEGLRGQEEMVRRRAEGCGDVRVRGLVGRLVEASAASYRSNEVVGLLSDEVVTWLREQLGRPTAGRREMGELAARLRGRELTKQEVLRVVAEWLGEGEGFVEVV